MELVLVIAMEAHRARVGFSDTLKMATGKT